MAEPVPILVPQEVVNDTTVRVISLSAVAGHRVSAGQAVVELETSKSNIQVEATADGWLCLLCKVGDDVPVGGLIGHVFASEEAYNAALAPAAKPEQAPSVDVGVTVFSDEARALLQSSGLSEAAFQGMAFVRAADVRARLNPQPSAPPIESAPVPVAAPAAAVVPDEPFQQTFAEDWPLGQLIRADLHRVNGRHDNKEWFEQWLNNPAFRFVMWFRIAQWARRKPLTKLLVYPVARYFLNRIHYQTGIRLPLSVKAGPGLFLGHWGSMIISPRCTIGANGTLSNDINIGGAGGGNGQGVPQLGDNVFVGPGVRIAGPIMIGQNAAIMGNTLVTATIPPNSIAIGVPHRISGRHDDNVFVSHRDYPSPEPASASAP